MARVFLKEGAGLGLTSGCDSPVPTRARPSTLILPKDAFAPSLPDGPSISVHASACDLWQSPCFSPFGGSTVSGLSPSPFSRGSTPSPHGGLWP